MASLSNKGFTEYAKRKDAYKPSSLLGKTAGFFGLSDDDMRDVDDYMGGGQGWIPDQIVPPMQGGWGATGGYFPSSSVSTRTPTTFEDKKAINQSTPTSPLFDAMNNDNNQTYSPAMYTDEDLNSSFMEPDGVSEEYDDYGSSSGTPWDTFTAPEEPTALDAREFAKGGPDGFDPTSNASVKQLQQLMGFSEEDQDGILGPQTEKALRKLQGVPYQEPQSKQEMHIPEGQPGSPGFSYEDTKAPTKKPGLFGKLKNWMSSQKGTDRSDAGGSGYGADAGTQYTPQGEEDIHYGGPQGKATTLQGGGSLFGNNLGSPETAPIPAPDRPSIPVETDDEFFDEDINIEDTEMDGDFQDGVPLDYIHEQSNLYPDKIIKDIKAGYNNEAIDNEFGDWRDPSYQDISEASSVNQFNRQKGLTPGTIDYGSNAPEIYERDYTEGEEVYWDKEDQDASGYTGSRFTNPALDATKTDTKATYDEYGKLNIIPGSAGHFAQGTGGVGMQVNNNLQDMQFGNNLSQFGENANQSGTENIPPNTVPPGENNALTQAMENEQSGEKFIKGQPNENGRYKDADGQIIQLSEIRDDKGRFMGWGNPEDDEDSSEWTGEEGQYDINFPDNQTVMPWEAEQNVGPYRPQRSRQDILAEFQSKAHQNRYK